MKPSPAKTFLQSTISSFFADRPSQSPSNWCQANLIFDEPDNRGPFSLAGREYIREPLDCWADPTISDMVEVFGSQTGKTGGIMGGAAWSIVNEPARIFWVMPTRPTVQKFSRTRWLHMLMRSPATAALVPTGARRHEFSTFEQSIGNAIVDMVWSNSPATLAGTPARIVVLDEVDKFNTGGGKEADAVNLAEQRSKSFASPKRIKTSTPTLPQGLIWQEFGKTDQRRRFLPCPFCGKFVVLIWSKNYSVFKKTGEEASIEWDSEAKRKDGTWDLARVENSARFGCPHCGGHIRDGHKTAMDRAGVWRPTTTAARGFRGWHLSSLYSASAECNAGKLAVKFLQAKNSLLGLQGFINGDLAEPYQAQDTLQERIELVTSKVEVTAEWRKLLTVDCQAKAPFFWHVVRAWNGGNSNAVSAGPLDTWEEIRETQQRHTIPDVCVSIDSGFGAKSDAEVYKTCVRFAELQETAAGKVLAIGWVPSKGMPSRKRWKDPATGLLIPWYLATVDPFVGTASAGQVCQTLFEFSGDFFKDILESLRGKKTGFKWSVSEDVSSDDYWRHLDSEVKTAVLNKRTGRVAHEWRKRSEHWPNHLMDCETLQIAFASFHKFFPLE